MNNLKVKEEKMEKIFEELKERVEDYFITFNWFSVINAIFLFILIVMNAFYILGTLITNVSGITVDNLPKVNVLFYTLSIIGLGYYLSSVLNIKRIVQIIFGYFTYLGVSYFLLLTSFINRPDFKISKTFSNDFWEFRYLLTLGLIIGVSILFKLLFQYWYSATLDYFQVSPVLLISGLLAVSILCDSRLLDLIILTLKPIIDAGNSVQISGEFFKFILKLLLLSWLASFVVIKSTSDIWHNKVSLSLATSSSLFFALIFNYTLQFGVKGSGDYYGYYVYEGAIIYQILFLFTFFILLYCLVNRYVLVTISILFLGVIASVVNALKVSMRSEPLLITDLVWLKQLGLLFTFVEKSFVTKLFISIFLILTVYYILNKFFFRGKIIKNIFIRINIILALGLFINSVLNIFRNENFNKIRDDVPIISVLNNRHDVNWLGFEFNARMKSVSYVWSKQLSKKLMTEPENYNEQSIENLYNKYSELANVINQERSDNIKDQTVIYLLSESFANPAHLDGITLSEDPIPYINSLSQQTTSGMMKSDFYGGGTANMEFQSLTGLPFYNFSSSIAIAYTEVVPKLSFMPSISDHFDPKARIAMHPANARNYDRYNIYYNTLGFEKFLADSGTKDKFTNKEPVGVYTGDKVVYQNILEQIDTSKNQFFSIITMQNHTPWSANGPLELIATGQGFNETEAKNLLSYTRLLRHTDMATQDFLAKLKEIDKKITVVFYGDHLPGAYPMTVFKDRPETQYLTDYFIWSNYTDNKLNYPLVNSSDFTAALLEHTNSKVSPYYALLTEILQKASVNQDPNQLTEEQISIANDLKLIQYDLSSGKNYILEHPDFFEIKP